MNKTREILAAYRALAPALLTVFAVLVILHYTFPEIF
jgi:hypothetical protein